MTAQIGAGLCWARRQHHIAYAQPSKLSVDVGVDQDWPRVPSQSTSCARFQLIQEERIPFVQERSRGSGRRESGSIGAVFGR